MTKSNVSPTQSLDRAIDLLARVVSRAQDGIALPELAAASGLSKPTAHRLLVGLRNAGLIDYYSTSRNFFPSFKLYRMGLAAGERFNLEEVAGESMDRLALETGDTVYLSVRSGHQAVCVARRIGPFPIKTLTLEVGDLRPLGLGAGSLALLSALSEDEREAILHRNQAELQINKAMSLDAIRCYCEQARSSGVAVNDGLMLPEMAAIAMLIRRPGGEVCGAISIAAIRSRMQLPRRNEVIERLATEIRYIENLLAKDARGEATDVSRKVETRHN